MDWRMNHISHITCDIVSSKLRTLDKHNILIDENFSRKDCSYINLLVAQIFMGYILFIRAGTPSHKPVMTCDLWISTGKYISHHEM